MFNPGDIITAYHAGYHKCVGTNGKLVQYQTVMNSKGKLINSPKVRECHEGFCTKIDTKAILAMKVEAAKDYLNRINMIIELEKLYRRRGHKSGQ